MLSILLLNKAIADNYYKNENQGIMINLYLEFSTLATCDLISVRFLICLIRLTVNCI